MGSRRSRPLAAAGRRLGIEIEHVLHAGDVVGVDLRDAPHLRRDGLRSASAKRRRTVSRDRLSCAVSLTISPASRCSAWGAARRRVCAGGRYQQGFLLAGQLAFGAGARSSLRARSRLPSTNRRLVRYTVEPPTPTLAAISSSPTPASAASRICARLSLRAACRPPLRRVRVHRARIGSGSRDNLHSWPPPVRRRSGIDK